MWKTHSFTPWEHDRSELPEVTRVDATQKRCQVCRDTRFIDIHWKMWDIPHKYHEIYHFIEYYTLISISIYNYIHTHIYYQKQDISINHQQKIGNFHNFPAYSRHVRVSKPGAGWIRGPCRQPGGDFHQIFQGRCGKAMVSIGKWSTHGGFSWIFHIELLVYFFWYPRDVDDQKKHVSVMYCTENRWKWMNMECSATELTEFTVNMVAF